MALSLVRFDSECEELRRNVLRLHIIANSDSDEDQQLKLAVRDAVLRTADGFFEKNMTLREAEKTVEDHLPQLQAAANNVIAGNGKKYAADITLEDSFFETREYEDFTLPAGTYRSVMVRLGKAKGKNWWCVVFPAICIPAAAPEARLTDAVSKDAARVADNPDRYQMRFKIVEIWQDFKKFLRDQ